MIAEIDSRKGAGWPNVIINTETSFSHRPDIKGTFSIFSNLSGASYCMVDGRKVRVEEDMFFISNKGQEYTLDIDEPAPTETFNIHFSTKMVEEYMGSLGENEDYLLDNTCGSNNDVAFFTRLYPKDAYFNSVIHLLKRKGHSGELTDLMTEELLAALLQHFLDTNKLLKEEVASIRTAKASTRGEIYKRLSMATDHIHSYYAQDITLDDLAGRACMSKFHFLRLFKEVLGRTPYQYIASVRLTKAAGLLRSTALTAAEISWMVGYEDPTSFNRAFYNFHKYRPQAYREMAK